MTVWDSLVGQKLVVASLQRAAAGDGMTHAWLFVGPPGSGRSNTALAFAAALQCEAADHGGGAGCGECKPCRTVLGGSHADVTVVRTERLSIGVDQVRELVRKSALSPTGEKWQVLLVEDSDRLTDQACNALLKAIEEPTARTVWLLCAPTTEDVLPTIRSRCRLVSLTTPTAPEVSDFLVRSLGVAEPLAAAAARASQGHIGRAKALATDEDVRRRRNEIVHLPAKLRTLGDCLNAATKIHEFAKEEAEVISAGHDEREKAELDQAYGVETRGRRPREYAPALRELEKQQTTRAKRRVLDGVDRMLVDLTSVYRDAIALAWAAPGPLVNEELRGDIATLVREISPDRMLQMVDAIFTAREQMLEFNVPPQLALESMMMALRLGGRREGHAGHGAASGARFGLAAAPGGHR